MERDELRVSKLMEMLPKLVLTDITEKEIETIKKIREIRIAFEGIDEDFIDEISKGEIFFGRAFRGNEAYDILVNLENILESRIEDSILKLH